MHELSFHRGKTYEVKRGQTVGEIAYAFSISPYELIRLNQIETLSEGLILFLPDEGERFEGGTAKKGVFPTLFVAKGEAKA